MLPQQERPRSNRFWDRRDTIRHTSSNDCLRRQCTSYCPIRGKEPEWVGLNHKRRITQPFAGIESVTRRIESVLPGQPQLPRNSAAMKQAKAAIDAGVARPTVADLRQRMPGANVQLQLFCRGSWDDVGADLERWVAEIVPKTGVPTSIAVAAVAVHGEHRAAAVLVK